jgi:rRNA-processing protein FCF1
MSEEKKKKPDEGFDIFVANQTYPEAEKIFTARLKPLDEIKDDCFIILDTNSLLVPYNTGKESVEQIKRTYRSLVAKKRLIVPGQVAREFAKNRANKIVELFQQLSRKANTPKLQRGKYPLLESLEEYQKALRLEEEIDETLGDYREAIEKVLNHIKQWTWNDPVSLMYGELFDSSVVFDPPVDKETIQVELTRRQIHGVPPGYKDASKDDSGIGDFLIWQTILETGKAHKKSVIFVSGEEKADWRYKSEGQTLYPRFELADEYRRYSDGQSFHIVQFSSFLNLYGASEDVVEEVRQKEQQTRLEASSAPQSALIAREGYRRGYEAEEAIHRWLITKYPSQRIVREPDFGLPIRPDFAVTDNDSNIKAVEVVLARQGQHPVMILRRVSDKALAGYYGIREGKLREFMLTIVGDNPDNILEIAGRFERSNARISGVSYYFFYLGHDGELEEVYSI